MKTCIQIAEVWIPSRDRTTLEHHDGLYGEHRRFARASRELCFGYDEGLPGKAWAARQPVLRKDLGASWFKRAEAAAEAKLSCGVAIPLAGALLEKGCNTDAPPGPGRGNRGTVLLTSY